jgi:hypothetical protein
MILLFAPPGAAFPSAAGALVHGCPRASFRLFGFDTAMLVALFDVFSLTLLFARITRFISSRHIISFLFY